ncbi:MAG TPA: glycosyl hydrolase family 18 protein [Edaphobacter sp.]
MRFCSGLVAAMVVCLSMVAHAAQPKKHDKVIIGYIFPGRSGPIDPNTVAASRLTRINYAFFRVSDGVITEGGQNDAVNLAALNSLKQANSALQVVVSVGGGGEGSAGFSDMAVTAEGRRRFVDSAIAAVEKYHLDGIDIDWEYPGYTHAQGVNVRPEDKGNYTALLRELRLRFNREQKLLHRRLYTSSATGATRIWLDHTDMRQASRWLDSVNMMCYDWYMTEKNTGHDSPLYTSPQDPKAISIDDAVKMYRTAGVPMKKIVIGVPFYGRKWAGVEAGATHGLWQPLAASNAAPEEMVFRTIAPMVNAQGYVRYWDPVGMTPYLYNAAEKSFVTYNDAEAELARTTYVKAHHLQGIMFWQYTGDSNNVLLDAIGKGFGW